MQQESFEVQGQLRKTELLECCEWGENRAERRILPWQAEICEGRMVRLKGGWK